MTDCVVVFVTAANRQEAEKIGRELVDQRLAACANLVSEVTSIFRWQGNIDTEQEVLMVLKTRAAQFPAVVERVKALHSYEVPEIIALPILDGSQSYLDWIKASTEPLGSE